MQEWQTDLLHEQSNWPQKQLHYLLMIANGQAVKKWKHYSTPTSDITTVKLA
jgi:hypothetical protein